MLIELFILIMFVFKILNFSHEAGAHYFNTCCNFFLLYACMWPISGWIVLQAIYDVYDSNNLKLNKKEVRGREGFYKKIISRQISASCEYQKTCSHFMREATSAFGLFGGLLLGIDRLSRCGASQNTYSFLPSLIDQENYLLIEQMKHYE